MESAAVRHQREPAAVFMKPTDDPQPAAFHLADHLFRHEAEKIVSILTGIYGTRNLQLAEDVVQEAMIRALKTWPLGGVPENPAAWLLRTAKNLAIDQLRREKNFLGKQVAIIAETENWAGPDESGRPFQPSPRPRRNPARAQPFVTAPRRLRNILRCIPFS